MEVVVGGSAKVTGWREDMVLERSVSLRGLTDLQSQIRVDEGARIKLRVEGAGLLASDDKIARRR